MKPESRRRVLPNLGIRERVRGLLVIAGVVAFVAAIPAIVGALDNQWVHQGDQSVIDSELAEDNDPPPAGNGPNNCTGVVGIPGGLSPGWVRVGGATSPHTPIVELSGQILDPQAYVAFSGSDSIPSKFKTNAFVTHTDLSFSHFSRDVNVFVTLDPEDRGFLANGNFLEGDTNERGHLEVEWERGAIPMYAFPAIGDRITVFGSHIWDCGHGDTWIELPGDDDTFRTEIHPPMGWVMFRQSADADGVPQGGKESQSPWIWYEATDLKGQGETFPSSGLLETAVQATVADAYFSSYGGNAVESLNGCDTPDPDAKCYDQDDRSELNGGTDSDSWEWAQPVLDNDYSFFVPAPPIPAGAPGDVEMVWGREDRCSEVPPDPTFPNKYDHKEAVDGVEGDDVFTIYEDDRGIGSATCNPANDGQEPWTVETDRAGTAVWNESGQPGIRFTVRARTGRDGIDDTADDPTYPNSDYISFAYRVKVAWDHVPADADRARTYRVDFDDLRVYEDAEICGNDGEWVMSLRVNDQYIHPVEGTAPDDNDSDDIPEPFWETGAIDDGLCDGGPDDEFKTYTMGTDGADLLTRYVTVIKDQPIEVWDRTYEKDDITDDLFEVYREFYPQPVGTAASHILGYPHDNVEGAHTISLAITDVTPSQPATGPLAFGDPQYGPNSDTGGILRISGKTPVTFEAPAGATGFEWRVWPEGASPGAWQFDYDNSDGFVFHFPDAVTANGSYVVEWATINASLQVSQRQRTTIQLDNEPPVLTVPDDFWVYANQTAGAKVEYVVTAVDNFPGPIEIVCSPASGEIFPNGTNAPRVTTVNCTATDAVENQSADSFDVTVVSPVGYVNDYALLGLEWLDVARDVLVVSGSIGAYDASDGITREPGLELRIALDGLLPPTGIVAGDTVELGARVAAGDVVYADSLDAATDATYTPHGPCDPNEAASTVRCGYVPLWATLPAFQGPGSVGSDVDVSGPGNVLIAGDYGALSLKAKAEITLVGSYSFTSVAMKPGAVLRFNGPTTIVIAGRIVLEAGATVEPAGTATPSDFVAFVSGVDVDPNRPAVVVKPNAVVRANIYAPYGTAVIEPNAVVDGALIARGIEIGADVVVTRDSAFVLP